MASLDCACASSASASSQQRRILRTRRLSPETLGSQRTPAGTFRIKDLSKLGTTVNGTPVPPSLQMAEGGPKDLDRWTDIPDRARIGLAGVVSLEFEKTS